MIEVEGRELRADREVVAVPRCPGSDTPEHRRSVGRQVHRLGRHAQLADFDPGAAAIAAQPFLVRPRRAGGSGGTYRTSCWSAVTAGYAWSIKRAGQLAVPEVADALGWAGEVFAARGWRHEIWSGAEPVLLANVRFLAGYRFPAG